ncbi:ribonuclease P protein component 1 [Halobacterium rubrum]|uniref:ribonuclease P protein component 1 n=1 Tax=Halobacterium TaxID=2239 RepID=UPI001F2553A0|nr:MULTISPECIES: ribonuclease P protein component 1 [Halobacterium]MDH5019549.1 ribonuclease P protein component 1 [Halobacterium rubrum]
MSLTPETLPRHELVGLHARVVEDTDQSRVGIEGCVVRETMQTLVLECDSGVRQVPKAGATFEFRLTDEAAAPDNGAGTAFKPAGGDGRQTTGESVAYVTVDGVKLLSRPERRSENGVDSKWR